ncbi:MAG: 8-oxo-dGTP diphosphatase [Clostridia bacterium]|nr:8-oxo-dGTP diphosphatase [Clostridia bacterium]
MARIEPIELANLCLISDGDRILLQNRVKRDWQGYALPGGHVEPKESIVEAVIREIYEETGLTIAAPKLCGVKQFQTEAGRYLVFLFKADRFTGELRSSDEGEMHWIKRSELASVPTVPDFAELLAVFDREDLTEFLYEKTPENDWSVRLL